MQSGCTHARTQVIAKRDGVDYVRCLDCGQICEAEDLDSTPVYDEEDESTKTKSPTQAR